MKVKIQPNPLWEKRPIKLKNGWWSGSRIIVDDNGNSGKVIDEVKSPFRIGEDLYNWQHGKSFKIKDVKVKKENNAWFWIVAFEE